VNEDSRDLPAALLEAGARFLVVGAHALPPRRMDRADLEALGEPLS